MNRFTRICAGLRKPAVRYLASYCLSSYPSTQKPLFSVSGYWTTVGLAAATVAGVYTAFAWLGGRGFLLLWLSAEALFIFINAARCWLFNRQVIEAEIDPDRIRCDFEKFLRSLSSLDHLDHLKDWFVDDAFAALPTENIMDLISYAFGFRSRKKTRATCQLEQLLRALLERFQSCTGNRIRSGCKPNARFRSHLWENINFFHYPLSLYFFMETLDVVFAFLMSRAGFLSSCYRQRRYFMRVPGTQVHRCPILFIHGLGIGPLIYFPFIWLLCQLGHPLLLLQMRHLSCRLCFKAPSIDEVVSDIQGILELLRVEKCIVIGHSYGTFIASRLNALHPNKVMGLCMLDPVCCVMHNPKLISTFVYGRLRWRPLRNCVNALILSFFRHDPSIAVAVSRNFRWTQLNLWPEDIPSKTILVVSEADMLVPVEDVKRVFKKTCAKLLVHPSHSHGSFLADPEWQQAIVRHIQETFK